MSRVASFSAAAQHVWTEPRFVAEVEWHSEYGIGAQLGAQVPREEMARFVAGGGWAKPDRVLVLEVYEPPDWDWWEPTSEWRRKAARDREFDARLK